ncbi:hypothetical protein GCM10009765_08200 [Fodinicola feengrottensis]|uniref:Exo-alpha-sialidase n=2 Tax=Fodinicola feengrottensis TaxID=435914 RepID=A0ABN2FXT6_9ACTN
MYALTGDRREAEDVVQEAFVRAVVHSAIDPATGVLHLLAHQPAKTIGAARLGGDGTIWVSYKDGPSALDSSSGIAVTHDGGHSWITRQITQPDGRVVGPVISSDGIRAYADLSHLSQSSGNRILMTDNGGQTWTQRDGDISLPASPYSLPDGSIIGVDVQHTPFSVVVTADQGRTSTPVTAANNPSTFGRTADGLYVLADRGANPSDYLVSTDGRHWTKSPRP